MTVWPGGGGQLRQVKSAVKKNWLQYRCSITICTHDSLAGEGGLFGHGQIWSHTKVV